MTLVFGNGFKLDVDQINECQNMINCTAERASSISELVDSISDGLEEIEIEGSDYKFVGYTTIDAVNNIYYTDMNNGELITKLNLTLSNIPRTE